MKSHTGAKKLLVAATFAGFALSLASTPGSLEASPRDDHEIQAPVNVQPDLARLAARPEPSPGDVQAP